MSSSQSSRRQFLQKSAAASLGLTLTPSLFANEGAPTPPVRVPDSAEPSPEWRNKQDGMAYRMLGRTGMMVSELVYGSFAFSDKKSFPILDDLIGRGVNYVDTASAYGKGRVERTLGQYFKASGNRDKIFLSTKLSGYYGFVATASKEIEIGLPQSKKDALRKKAEDRIAERRVLTPGYHMNYFGGQEEQVYKTYYRQQVLREYSLKSGWQKRIKDHARTLLEQGLQRLQTDHLDVLHCPHGIAMPDLMDEEPLREIFEDFKREGLIRAAAVSFHNDVAANLAKVIEVGYYDAAMFAYNVGNHAALENLIYRAGNAGLGMIAMKVARLFSMGRQADWPKRKLGTAIPGTDLSVHAKAYLWALQNPHLSCCVSQMESLGEVAENATIVGQKVKVRPV